MNKYLVEVYMETDYSLSLHEAPDGGIDLGHVDDEIFHRMFQKLRKHVSLVLLKDESKIVIRRQLATAVLDFDNIPAIYA